MGSHVSEADDPGQQEDAKGVSGTLHRKLSILEVLVAHVEYFTRVQARQDVHNDKEGDYHIYARQVEHTSRESDRDADHLAEPKYEVEGFHLHSKTFGQLEMRKEAAILTLEMSGENWNAFASLPSGATATGSFAFVEAFLDAIFTADSDTFKLK